MKRFLLSLACVVLLALSVPYVAVLRAAVVHVQAGATSDAAGGTTVSVTLGSAVGSGNAIAGCVMWATASGSPTVSVGGAAATVVRTVNDIEGEAKSASSFYLANVTNAATTITATVPSGTYHAMVVHEISGVDTTSPLETETGQAGTGLSGANSGTTSGSASAGAYVFGCSVDAFDWHATQFSAGSGYTIPTNSAAGSASTFPIAGEYKIQGSASTVQATFSVANDGDFGTFVLALKAAAGGGGGSPAPGRLLMLGIGDHP